MNLFVIRRVCSAAILLASYALLSACSSVGAFNQPLPLAAGPTPEITGKAAEGKLQCVASNLSRSQRSIPFGVIAAPDKTGKANIAGTDATGAFNTQGAADMMVSSLGRAGVRIVELGPDYRTILDWSMLKASQGLIGDGVKRPATEMVKGEDGKLTEVETKIPNIPLRKGTVFPVRYAVSGAITSLDFIPGGGAQGGAYGATLGYNQNRANIRIDLRLVEMPVGDEIGGRVVATTTVVKQVVNDSVNLSLTRYFGSAQPLLVNFDAGSQRREALQLSTGDMLDLAIGDLLEQVFLKKRSPCSNNIISALY